MEGGEREKWRERDKNAESEIFGTKLTNLCFR